MYIKQSKTASWNANGFDGLLVEPDGKKAVLNGALLRPQNGRVTFFRGTQDECEEMHCKILEAMGNGCEMFDVQNPVTEPPQDEAKPATSKRRGRSTQEDANA